LFTSDRLGKLKHEQLKEISGIAASRYNSGFLWAHNDSGGKPEVYLLNEALELKMVCRLKNAICYDWEDMAIGSGPEPGKSYIYIGDIGDNSRKRLYKTIYRFEEPVFKQTVKTDTVVISQFDKIVFRLEDGCKDMEALMVDNEASNIFLFSKRERVTSLYQLDIRIANDTLIAKRIGSLSIKRIVGADLAGNGKEMVVKNYGHIYYWNNIEQLPLDKLVLEKPVRIRYRHEPQGEAIAWAFNQRGFYTLSERPLGLPSFLYYYYYNE